MVTRPQIEKLSARIEALADCSLALTTVPASYMRGRSAVSQMGEC